MEQIYLDVAQPEDSAEARVRRLEVFHFSPRYSGMADRLYHEAATAFGGGDACAPRPVRSEERPSP